MVVEHNEALRALGRLPLPVDKAKELEALEELEAEWEMFERRMEHVVEQLAVNRKAEAALRGIGNLPSDAEIDAVADSVVEARVYEAAAAVYVNDVAQFEKLTADIAEKNRLAKEFKRGSEEMADARATLKAYLAPAISRVASSLIADMTNNTLTDVIVDEDMEITVNGQSLETLSGGAETVANIALRLALGQVLVRQTFPVFLGDEMDGDQDERRREATLEAMVALKKRVKQLILITHRNVEVADHVIDFGDKQGE